MTAAEPQRDTVWVIGGGTIGFWPTGTLGGDGRCPVGSPCHAGTTVTMCLTDADRREPIRRLLTADCL